ncbi:transaldolase [Streptomyces sp. UNOC14_S4]|nr:transaldolase [Streptomyces sp. UNOC14_S4]
MTRTDLRKGGPLSMRSYPEGNGGLGQLAAEGVSPWLAGLHGGHLVDDDLAELVAERKIRGAVQHPGGTAEGLRESAAYRDRLREFAAVEPDAEAAVRALVADDVRRACDSLHEVFTSGRCGDGWVSVCANPAYAHDAEAMTAEARELAEAVGRPNVLVGIPATRAGLAAVTACLGLGIGVDIRGVCSPECYEAVVEACFRGLELAVERGRDLAGIASAVTVDVGRVDVHTDARLAHVGGARADALPGVAGLAVARLVYRAWDESLGTDRWRALVARGARPQTLLWATGWNPGICRAESFVGWGTAIALSRTRLDYLDCHGDGLLRGDTLTGGHVAARRALAELEERGIRLADICRSLEEVEVAELAVAWRELTVTADAMLHAALPAARNV